MKKYILCFLLQLFYSFLNAQEKRLALVIGNENYNKGELRNPVNDALLMKGILEKLNFEVILDTNLKSRNDLLNSINSFGEKRKNYNVGLVYYAGHGVQLNGKNYLLATKERYESKINVEDNGVNVGRILDFFELAKNEINILILDACRNNPFEKNWIESSRSLDDGIGLAPLSSSGNIIAFSTSAGKTAADGNENSTNSNYCLSLVKNMITPDLDIDQIFRNVRKEVREVSDGNQLPTVDNHYEGADFYFIKSTYIDKINQIDSLININDFDLALEYVTFILTKSPNNKQALLRRGRIEYIKKNKNYDGFHLIKADSLYPKDPEVLEYLGRYYATIGDLEKAIGSIDLAISIDNYDPQLYFWKARFFVNKNEIEKAEIEYTKSIMLDSSVNRFVNRAEFFIQFKKYFQATSDFTTAIELDINNPELYGKRAKCYLYMKENTFALKDLDKAIELNPNSPYYYNNRADFYKDYIQEYDLALKDYETAIKISTDAYQTSRALNNTSLIYEKQKQYDLAIKECTKAIEILPMEALLYSNRANVYKIQEKYELALVDYEKAIELNKDNPKWYEQRAKCYVAMMENTFALKDLDKTIELAPEYPYYYNNRADFYKDFIHDNDLALKDYETALKISTDAYQTSRALNNRSLIYEKQKQYDLAIKECTKAIEILPMEALFYSNRANVYKIQEKYELALVDYKKAIELNKDNPYCFEQRAQCYVAMKKISFALKDLDKAIELTPNDPYHYNNRADFYNDFIHDNDLALKDYETAIKVSTDVFETTRALNNKALIYEKQKQYYLAIEEYTKAIEIDPKEALFYSNRANVYKIQEKYELALVDNKKAIELDKENPQWYQQRGEFNENFMNKPYDALIDYSLAIALDSSVINNWWHRGKLFSEKINNQQLAILDFDQILKIEPNNINALNWRTIFYERKNDIKNAIKGYQKIIALGDSIKKLDYKLEDYGWANINLALIYQCENKLEDALSLYNEGINYMPDFAKSYYTRSWFFSLYLSKYQEAIQDLSTSINLDSKNPYWYLNRAKIYQLMGEQKKSKNDFDESVKISNESSIYLAQRGNFYSITGQYEKAKKDFKESFRKDTTNRRLYHFITEDLIRQGKFDEAIKNASITIEFFKYDTVSFEQLGRIYFTKNDFYKSLSSYLQAAFIMEFNEGDKTIRPDDIQVFLSDIYIEIGEIYKVIKQNELMCEALNKALDNIKYEIRPDRQSTIKLIKNKRENCLN